jgi:hypothetical protein
MTTKSLGQPKRNKPRLNITLDAGTLRLLEKATKSMKIGQSACIELALRDWFVKEKIR